MEPYFSVTVGLSLSWTHAFLNINNFNCYHLLMYLLTMFFTMFIYLGLCLTLKMHDNIAYYISYH